MSQINLKLAQIAPLKRSEYLRGSLDQKNLDRLRAVRDGGRDWPFPPVEVRKLEKPRKVKGVEYLYRIVDGEHRRALAAEVKRAEIPAVVVKLSEAEGDVRALEAAITGPLPLNHRKRGAWFKHLVKDRKFKVPALAKRLHLTPRSVYRMMRDPEGLNRPTKPQKSREKATEGTKPPQEVSWTPESFFTALAALTKEARKHADAVQSFYRQHKDKVSPHVDPLLELLQ